MRTIKVFNGDEFTYDPDNMDQYYTDDYMRDVYLIHRTYPLGLASPIQEGETQTDTEMRRILRDKAIAMQIRKDKKKD